MSVHIPDRSEMLKDSGENLTTVTNFGGGQGPGSDADFAPVSEPRSIFYEFDRWLSSARIQSMSRPAEFP